MKKTFYKVLSLFSILFLSSCNSNSNNNDNTNIEDTITLNSITSDGIAPINKLNSIDTSVLETSKEGELEEIDSDKTLSGYYYNGVNITISKNSEINLTLDNATIYQNKESGKALWNTNKNVTVNLYLKEGTTSYIYNNFEDNNTLHIKGNLNISGKGKLVVISGSKSAIKVSKKITISESNLYLEALNYGINAETLEASNASINVNYASKDGIRTEVENESVSSRIEFDDSIGYVKFIDVDYKANVEGDGIQANTYIDIQGGDIDISTQGSFVSYSEKDEYELSDDDFKWIKSGSSYKKIDSDTIGHNYSKYLALIQSSKGLKVDALKYTLDSDPSNELEVESTSYYLNISSGCNLNLITTDTSIKVDYGDILINGDSKININTGNKGIASDHDIIIEDSNTSINISNSYEGIEASHININDGDIIISSNDDGINAASDYTSNEYSNLSININGGKVSINSNADGLDSNGSIYFNGGKTYVLGESSGANEALDADNKIYFNGGEVLAFGSSEMSNTKNYVTNNDTYVFSLINNCDSNKQVSIKDSSSNYLVKTTVPKSFSELVYSHLTLKKGTYYVSYGDNVLEITLSNNVTSSGKSNRNDRPNRP